MKYLRRFRWRLYCNLSRKLEQLIPAEYEGTVEIVPPVKGNKDLVIISLRIPRNVTKKLMWTLKPWRIK